MGGTMKGSRAVQKGSNPDNTFESSIFVGQCQKITTGAVSASAAQVVQSNVSVVRLVATAACHVKNGNGAQTAANDGSCFYVPAGVPCFLGVTPGDTIAAIQDTAAGVLYISEGAA